MDELISSSERLIMEYNQRGLNAPMSLRRAIDNAYNATPETWLDAMITLTDEYLNAWDGLR